MYSLIKIDATKNINEEGAVLGFVKQYKTKNAALRSAYAKNQLISSKTFNIEFVVYNEVTEELLRAAQ